MDGKGEAFLNRLFLTFKGEAQEHVVRMSSLLIDMEKASERSQRGVIIESIFREAHSFKGSAATLNLAEIEAVCQAMESLFSALKRSQIELSPALFDLLHGCMDTLGRLLISLGSEPSAAEKTHVRELVRRIHEAAERRRVPGTPEAEADRRPAGTETKQAIAPETGIEEPGSRQETGAEAGLIRSVGETVRISASKMDAIMLQVEELLTGKLALSQRLSDVRELRGIVLSRQKLNPRILPASKTLLAQAGQIDASVRQETGGVQVSRVLDSIDKDTRFLRQLDEKLAALEKAVEQDRRSLTAMVDCLLDDTKKALMLPFSSLFEVLPKLTRDLSRAEGKQVDLAIKGGDLEVDRRILEEIKEPLVHLLRNCIDHGIEKPGERMRFNKPACGKVAIEVVPREGNKVELIIADDGRGVDLERLKASAISSGAVSAAEAEKMSDTDALKVAFVSGVSTSPIITDISGRGLGLTIVQEKVERLGGRVSLESSAGRGSTFKAVLPITLATLRGVLVRVGDHLFIVPTGSVQRVLRLDAEDIKPLENRETIESDGRALPLVRLGEMLGLTSSRNKEESAHKLQAVILASGDTCIAFQVDEILGEQEVLVKGLGSQLERVRNIAGATVIGSGRLVPVLNPNDVVKSAARIPPGRPEEPGEPVVAEEKKSLLVIEDSVTARALLKNILESAGYAVKTAVDGIDGLTLLKSEHFDLAVSDVDMPRMNGFDLTARIRADKKLADLPVVLVTALDSREDRERGIDVGANAYIVKSSFDQSNLLQVIERLI